MKRRDAQAYNDIDKSKWGQRVRKFYPNLLIDVAISQGGKDFPALSIFTADERTVKEDKWVFSHTPVDNEMQISGNFEYTPLPVFSPEGQNVEFRHLKIAIDPMTQFMMSDSIKASGICEPKWAADHTPRLEGLWLWDEIQKKLSTVRSSSSSKNQK